MSLIVNFLCIRKDLSIDKSFLYAEKEGFEPPVPCGTTIFETVTFVHSVISPLDVIIFY